MNAFNAIMGNMLPQNLQTAIATARSLAGNMQDPQQMVQRFFPDAPANVRNSPESLLGWLQQTGRVNPQMVQMLRQMTGMQI